MAQNMIYSGKCLCVLLLLLGRLFYKRIKLVASVVLNILIFCLLVLLITERRVLKYLVIIANVFIPPSSSITFCSCILKLLFSAYIFRIVMTS